MKHLRKPLFILVMICVAVLMAACSPGNQAGLGGGNLISALLSVLAVREPSAAPLQAHHPEGFPPQTIMELRALTPGRFSYTDVTREGDVQVNVPVIVPAVSVLPIHTLRKDTLSSSDVRRMADIILSDIRYSHSQQENHTPHVSTFTRVSALLASIFPDAQFYLAGQTCIAAECPAGQGNAGLAAGQTLMVGQTVCGVPILPETPLALSSAGEPLGQSVGLMVSPFSDGERFSMEGSVATPVSTLVQDAALVPFEQIAGIIRAGIQSGRIHSIDSISLGYTLCSAQSTVREQAAQGAELVTIPTWEVVGSMAGPGAPEKGTFRIDALSGKPLEAAASQAPSVYSMAAALP